MIRRRWMRAFLLGLVSTLIVTFLLVISLSDNNKHEWSTAINRLDLKMTNPLNLAKPTVNVEGLRYKKLEIGMFAGFHFNEFHDFANNSIDADSQLKSSMQNNSEDMLKTSSNIVIKCQYCIHLAVACCLTGKETDRGQLGLTTTFLKSLFTFNPNNIYLHVFVMPRFSQSVIDVIDDFNSLGVNFTYTIYNASMPDINIMVKDGPIRSKNVTLSSLFKPCSAQRLFLPYSLPHLKKVLYIDTDTLVFGPLHSVWNDFNVFNLTHIYAMAFIARHPGFYDKRPYYQPYKGLTGHNAGVMLMDLERMRKISWYNITLDIIATLSGANWAYASDQDVLNYFNGLNPDHLFEMSCSHNWRFSYCRKYKQIPQECDNAHQIGITIMHGVSATFFKKSIFISRIYRIFNKFTFGSSIEENLIKPIKAALDKYGDYLCGNNGDIYYKQMQLYIDSFNKYKI